MSGKFEGTGEMAAGAGRVTTGMDFLAQPKIPPVKMKITIILLQFGGNRKSFVIFILNQVKYEKDVAAILRINIFIFSPF